MWPGDLAPDDADLGALDGLLCAVDVCEVLVLVRVFAVSELDAVARTCYALAGVPPSRLSAVNALELEQRA